jgi:hypothetical protein
MVPATLNAFCVCAASSFPGRFGCANVKRKADASSLPAPLTTNESDVIFMRHRILFFALAGGKGVRVWFWGGARLVAAHQLW